MTSAVTSTKKGIQLRLGIYINGGWAQDKSIRRFSKEKGGLTLADINPLGVLEFIGARFYEAEELRLALLAASKRRVAR